MIVNMSTHANVMIMNDDGTISRSFVQYRGNVITLGGRLYRHYLVAGKVRRLIDRGALSHVGIIPSSYPLSKAEYDNVIDKAVLPYFDSSISGDKGKSEVAQQIWKAFKDMDDYYTRTYHQKHGNDLERTHFPNLSSVPPEECNYLYLPKKRGRIKWCYIKVNTNNIHSFNQLKKNKYYGFHSLTLTAICKNK